MSLLSDLIDIAKGAFKGTIKVGRAVAEAAAPVIKVMMDGAHKLVDEVAKRAGKAFRQAPKTVRESLERDLQDVNERIAALRKKYQSGASLSQRDRDLLKHLKQRRWEINEQITGLDQVDHAQEMVEGEADYKPVVITDDNAHILQYHVGQNTYNKACPKCERAMVLQWDRKTKIPGLKDFFWGCSGWYFERDGKRVCDRTSPLSQDDLNLFANLNRSEFELKSTDLTRVTLDPNRAQRIRGALDSVHDEHRKRKLGIATYRCPLHGESLVLRRKKDTGADLLDEYFLGCPRWLHDNSGCNFLIKLKSAAQISSVLDSEVQKGVLQVSG